MNRFFFLCPRLLVGAVVSGILLLGCFPPFNQTWMVWVALIPVLLALHRWDEAWRFRPLWWSGYLLGLVYFGGCFWWLGLVTAVGALALVAYLAIYPAAWLCWAAWIWRRNLPYTSGRSLLIALELANAWIILEAIRGWAFSGFGWDTLGVALHDNLPLIQTARLGGVLLLSWVIVFVNVIGVLTLIRFYHEIRRDQVMLAHLDFNAAMLLVALLFAYGLTVLLQSRKEPLSELSYALVQPNIPQSLSDPMDTSDVFTRLKSLSRIAAAGHPELLMWPETTIGSLVETDPQFHYTVQEVQGMGNFALLLGSFYVSDGNVYNSAFFLPAPGEAPTIFEKNRLVPFGEYTPLAKQFPWLHHLMPFDTDVTPGTEPRIFTLPASGLKLAPLICFEDTLPSQVGAEARLQPDILVNLTNDGWFENSPGAEHHLINSVFSAVSTDLPLLRCANTGISAAINPHGGIEAILISDGRTVGVKGVLSRNLRWTPHHDTPYQRLGNWVVWLALLLNLRLRLTDLYRWGQRLINLRRYESPADRDICR